VTGQIGDLSGAGNNRQVPIRSIPINGPLDLRSTLAPLLGRFDRQGWWLTARTSRGPATLLVRRTRADLVGEAWGAGADSLLARLDGIGGLNDDPASFHTSHPVVGELHRRNPGLRVASSGRVFDELIVAIAGQKVTGAEAARSLAGLRRIFSEPAPGPNPALTLPPDPGRMANAAYWEFHEIHLEKRRADVIRRVSKKALEVDGLAVGDSGRAAAALKAFPGIGEWTVAETLIRSHGDADQLSVGDYHLKNLVVHHLAGRPRGTDDEMVELLDEFRPHRGRVVRLLHKLGHAPKYGPRIAPRNITSI
jgi:3-methyladenine DNA glycosylase/8-oxoguanine DNA glycosylase